MRHSAFFVVSKLWTPNSQAVLAQTNMFMYALNSIVEYVMYDMYIFCTYIIYIIYHLSAKIQISMSKSNAYTDASQNNPHQILVYDTIPVLTLDMIAVVITMLNLKLNTSKVSPSLTDIWSQKLTHRDASMKSISEEWGARFAFCGVLLWLGNDQTEGYG